MSLLEFGLSDATEGVQDEPDAIICYGTPGVGKSTFASGAEAPIFLDYEGSTRRLNVRRLYMKGKAHADTISVLTAIRDDEHDRKTLVIDTLDELAKVVYRAVCAEKGWASIDAPGFAKGEKYAVEKFWEPILSLVDQIRIQRGMEIIVLAHAQVQTFKSPMTADYDRWVPEVDKYAWGAWNKWSNCSMLAQIEGIITVDKSGKGKAKGAGKRILRTTDGVSWVAKNRHGLPDVLPLSYEEYDAARKRGVPADRIYAEAMDLLPKLTAEDQEKMRPYLEGIRQDSKALAQAVNRMREKASENEEPAAVAATIGGA